MRSPLSTPSKQRIYIYLLDLRVLCVLCGEFPDRYLPEQVFGAVADEALNSIGRL